MVIKIRTENNLHTSTFRGRIAEILLTKVLSISECRKAKDPNKKIFRITEDSKFNIINGVEVMLYKDYYLVVE